MIVKCIEIRDAMTCIPAMATRLRPVNEAQHWLLKRAGYGQLAETQAEIVLLTRLEDAETHYDPYDWDGGARTMTVAHDYIVRDFDELTDGDVVDIEYILGEKSERKLSERFTSPY